MMTDRRIREFAQLFIQARDSAIVSCDRGLDPNAQDVTSKRWRSSNMAPRDIIPDAVDAALGALLYLVDQGLLSLHFKASDGTLIDLTEAGMGELCGAYGAVWKFELSTQRAPDDFAELRKALEDKYGPKGSAT